MPNLTFHDVSLLNSPIPAHFYFCYISYYCFYNVFSVYRVTILTHILTRTTNWMFVPVQPLTSVQLKILPPFCNFIRYIHDFIFISFCKNESYLVDTGDVCTDCNLSNWKYNIYLLIKQCISYVWYAFFKAIKHYRVILKVSCFRLLNAFKTCLFNKHFKASMELNSKEYIHHSFCIQTFVLNLANVHLTHNIKIYTFTQYIINKKLSDCTFFL